MGIKSSREISVAAGATVALNAATLRWNPAGKHLVFQIYSCGAGDTLSLEASLDGTEWTEAYAITGPIWLQSGRLFYEPPPHWRVVAPAGNANPVRLKCGAGDARR